jgi:capsular polysaccharide transport system ATP-binding protein
MIHLTGVTDHPQVFGEKRPLLSNVDLVIARDRYALLSTTPGWHRPLIDVLAGIRPPQRGLVQHGGLVSWPMGRQGFIRGKGSGLKMVQLVCNLYGLDVRSSVDWLSELMTNPEYLLKPMADWPLFVRQEFSFALALIPDFDIYMIDGAVPFEPCRFTKLWQALFEARLASRTLILSTYRHSQMTDYCTKALIYERNRFRIEEHLADCIGKYPARQNRNDSSEQGAASFNGSSAAAEFSIF